MHTPVTDSDVLRILTDLARDRPNMRLRPALYKAMKQRKMAELKQQQKLHKRRWWAAIWHSE